MTQQNIAIPILHQEAQWLVVNKPPGLSVHNEEDSTNLLKEMCKILQVTNVYPVHRLDKETSGVQLLALTENMASHLSMQFQTHQIRKFYQGIVAGLLPPSGRWNLPLSDKAEGWKSPAGKAQDQKECETRFRSLKNSKYFSWMEFEILTGRQHQIRKHCALSGHALIGDPRYGNPKYNLKIQSIYQFERMALHCSQMQLMDGQIFKSPPPSDFDRLFPQGQ